MAHILIDALGADSPGARRHLDGFLPALRERSGGHRFRLVIRDSAAASLGPCAGGSIELWPVPDRISRAVPTRLLYDIVYLPYSVRSWGIDLVVTLSNFGPVWTPVPHVVFQRNAMHFSDEYLGRIDGLLRMEWRLRGLLTVAEMRFATINVTPTDAMAELIRDTHPSLEHKRFVTLPHGIDLSRFSAGDPGPRSAPLSFLYPTKIEAYKGVEVLVEATQLLAARRDDFEVRLTAPADGWPASIQHEIDAARRETWFERLDFMGPRPASSMPDVYRDADAIVYPSLCESFGFPLLEAMACGLPIVAGDLDVNREMCGDAAIYFDAYSPDALARSMESLLEREDLRRTLRQASERRIRSRDWSWGHYAERFVDVCELALDDDR